jgi:hypothetical protein
MGGAWADEALVNPVVCENSGRGLRGLAVVEVEHAAEPLTAFQRTCSDHLRLGRDEFAVKALVRPLLMVMVHELSNRSLEGSSPSGTIRSRHEDLADGTNLSA